ncbi:MAG: T9SS type A sorting domain-containing protein [Ignavibacteriae bacterium]|nr:T9SS type A sorting domain-containing protein [Ignavibacteriota bacterium]
MIRNIIIILLISFDLILLKINAYPQGLPNPPIFKSIILDGSGSNTYFKLNWAMHPSDTAGIIAFKIYKTNIFTSNYLLCTYFQTVNRYGNDTAWKYEFDPVYENNYTFYITAVRSAVPLNLESNHSNLLQARFKHGYVPVVFTSTPVTIGAAGVLYQYAATATSTDSAQINYSITTGPTPMIVNYLTGLVQWTPIVKGRYDVTLKAFLNFIPIGKADKGNKDGTMTDDIMIDTSDCEAEQSWLLLIKSCNEPTYFSGTVIDNNGDTVRSGTVTAFSANNFDKGSVYYGIIGNDGTYSVEVLEGAYKLSIEGSTFHKEWYHDKTTMDRADSTIAPCGQNARINWIVARNGPDTITFAYEPNLNELVNNQFSYNGVAISSSGRELRYTLDTAPEGMVVDSITGIVSWIPNNIGRFYVSLKAYLIDDSANSYAYKNFYIKVRTCINETFIKGIVADSAGNLIKTGNIEIHNDSGIDSLGIYYDRIQPDGSYFIKIDEGNSKIYTEGEGFYSQWYDNKLLKDSADAVSCPCGDTAEVNLLVYRTTPLKLEITSTPQSSIVLGSIYNYNPVLIGNNKREVRYLLEIAPAEMTCDQKTGAIMWSPTQAGGYKIILKAYLYTDSANSFVLQEWWIKVKSCTGESYISGSVLDENNNPVTNGNIKIVNESGIDSLGYYLGSVKDGYYRVLVDEGRCKVFAEGPAFRGEWYEDKTSQQTASPIDVQCGSNVTVNLKVHLFTDYTVSGKVSGESNGNPIENANVYFQSPDGLDSTVTNATGDYAIKLFEKFSYVAWANVPSLPLYLTQYYNQTGNITEANPVEFAGDINNINFVLHTAPFAENRMFGIVEDLTGEPVRSIVLNYLVFPADTSVAAMFDSRTFITNQSGAYEFDNMAEGQYILLAIPYPEMYVPGYFKRDSTAVSSWTDASLINIVTGEISGPHNITLTGIFPTTGKGVISGIITGDKLPAFLKKDDIPQAKEAVSGAVVITVDKDEKVRKYNLTNSMGAYSLDSLENGEYHVSVDKFGYGNYSYDVTINNSNQSEGEDAELDILIPVGVNDDNIKLPSDIRIFPNPSKEQFIIQSENELNLSGISIINIFGQSINIDKKIISLKPFTVVIKADNPADGLYFIKMDNKGKSIIKSVILLK